MLNHRHIVIKSMCLCVFYYVSMGLKNPCSPEIYQLFYLQRSVLT